MVKESNSGKMNIVHEANRIVDSADAVIIGAGIGGLSAAAYLARAGRRVIVLEQDLHVGGTAHVFCRNGFTFPAGPQSFTMPSLIADSLRELGVEQKLCFIRDSFQVRRGTMDVMISVPLSELAGQLAGYFPEEEKGIFEVIAILKKAALEPQYLIRQVPEDFEPARKLLDRYLKDQRLKDLLGSQGTGETVMSVALLAQMWRFMSETGIWYVGGGIDKVPMLLAERVRDLGGEIRLGERVKRILVNEGKASGVELAGGARIRSPFVISNADYRKTILELLPEGAVHEKEKVLRMPLTSSAFSVFLGVNREQVDFFAFRGDHLLVKLEEGNPVPWWQKRPLPEDFMKDEIWISWWSRHDPELAPPGCEALIIKVAAPYGPFAPLSGRGRGRHKDRYYSMKEEMGDALVAAAAKVVPGLPGSVMVREVATPLTYRYWGHRSEGSVAGWSWRSGDRAQSLVVTPVPGLLMVGLQSFTRLFYGGIGTSLYSGRYAAELVLSGKAGPE